MSGIASAFTDDLVLSKASGAGIKIDPANTKNKEPNFYE